MHRLLFVLCLISFFNPIALASETSISRIPIQPPLSSEAYEAYMHQVSLNISDEEGQCAKFFNRMMASRFNTPTFGNAWTIELKKENAQYLQNLWRLSESDFRRYEDFRLHHYKDRIKHFEQLYEVLDAELYPIGLLGGVYKYSTYKQTLLDFPQFVPQTHVAFVAGRKEFFILNDVGSPVTIRTIFEIKYGVIHPYEEEFLSNIVPLDRVLQPEEKFYYKDYLIEEQFRTLKSGSLLEVFLRKHRNNRKTPLVRPVSFSRISDLLIDEIELQRELLNDLGAVEYVSGITFESMNFEGKAVWRQTLRNRFLHLNRNNLSNVLVVPVPKYRD